MNIETVHPTYQRPPLLKTPRYLAKAIMCRVWMRMKQNGVSGLAIARLFNKDQGNICKAIQRGRYLPETKALIRSAEFDGIIPIGGVSIWHP